MFRRIVVIAAVVLLAGCRPAPGAASDDAPPADAFAVLSMADSLAATGGLWPGFDPRTIPVAMYDGERTLLFRHPSPPADFLPVAGREGVLAFPGRHPSVTANSSADIGGVSSATLMPAADDVSARSRAGTLIHEAFHVFQRARHPGWAANEVEAFTYPRDDARLLTLARLESGALRRALAAADDDRAACWGRVALAVRGERFALLPAGASAYERGTESNEGLASYVEARAVGRADSLVLPAADFGPAEFRLRGYATGAALARLLDRFSPDWKTSLERNDSTALDALLNVAMERRDGAGAGGVCAFTASERDGAGAAAVADVATLRDTLARERLDFLEQQGWRLAISASGTPLFPQSFDPLNVRVLGRGEVLHTRLLEVGNDAGTVKVLGHAALTAAAGAHPLFDGVAELTIAGLAARPTVVDTAGVVDVRADGVEVELRGAAVERAGQVVTIRLPPVR